MILITGGAGYIGSHVCVELMNAGHDIVVVDNLSNSSAEALERVQKITGKKLAFVEADIRDQATLEGLMRSHGVTSVMHFAGLKAVGESTQNPLLYYDNNVVGTLRLLNAMQTVGVTSLVFSSSATVYGAPQTLPVPETHQLSATNPYGRSKQIIEEILQDHVRASPDWRIAILRYFNPAGAHSSGHIGEDPKGAPNNLIPFIAQVAIGRREKLSIWGNDYATPDGTGVRDYIHVVDLALGHVCALQHLHEPGLFIANLGTGRGWSVLEVVEEFRRVSGAKIPFAFEPRRAGDVAACFADPSKAENSLGWKARHSLKQMCEDHWRWQKQNPNGYS